MTLSGVIEEKAPPTGGEVPIGGPRPPMWSEVKAKGKACKFCGRRARWRVFDSDMSSVILVCGRDFPFAISGWQSEYEPWKTGLGSAAGAKRGGDPPRAPEPARTWCMDRRARLAGFALADDERITSGALQRGARSLLAPRGKIVGGRPPRPFP